MRAALWVALAWSGVAMAEPPAAVPVDDAPAPETEEPADEAPADAAPERDGVLGTVDRPLVVRVSVDGVESTVEREWEKVTRALLDLQDSLYGHADGGVRRVGLTPGQGVAVRLRRDLSVHVEVLERGEETARVRLRMQDDAGETVDAVERAALVRDGETTEEPLDLAGPGEIVIEDLAVREGASVQLYLADGERVVLWLDEADADAAAPQP